MNYIKMSVEGNRLKITEDTITTEGSMNYDACQFSFDEQWNGFTKTAVFSVGESDCYRVSLENDACIIPSACIEKEGILQIGVFGVSDDDVIITTNSVAHHVTDGIEIVREWIEEDSSLVINAISELKKMAEEYKMSLSQRVSDEIERLKQSSGKAFCTEIQPDWYTPKAFSDSQAVTALSTSTQYSDFLNFRLNPLTEDFPEYVTREEIGKDASGEFSVYAYSFTPTVYEKTILVITCLHGSDKCALLSLSHFLDCLCRDHESDKTLKKLHENVKITVIPAVNPYALKINSSYNKNNVNIAYNFPHVWDECTRYRKGGSAADQPETQNVMAYLERLKDDKLCATIELHTSNTTYAGRTVYYTRNQANCATALADLVNNFNYNVSDSDYMDKAILAASNNAYFSDYAADTYGLNTCQLVWTTNLYGGAFNDYCITKYTEFIGNAFRVMADNSRFIPKRKAQPFLKHISWKSKNDDDVFTVNSTASFEKMPISAYKLRLDAPYNILLNGYVGLDVSESCTVKINPVLYQKYSSELDYKQRRDASNFTQEILLTAGKHIVPISSVLQGFFTCYNFSDDCCYTEEMMFVLMFSASVGGKVRVNSFSLIFNAMPSDAEKPVEISSPVGLSADYSADEIPTQEIVYPLMNYTEYDSYFNN